MNIRTPSHAVIIAAITLLALVGIIVLAAMNRSVPEILPAVGLSGVAALAGLSIPTTPAQAAAAAAAPTETP